MKNTLRFGLILLTAFLFHFSVRAQAVDEGIGLPLPAFEFAGLDGKKVTPASFPAGQPIIVIYFDPYCDHCQQQAKWIKESIQKFKGISILWVSFNVLEDTKPFPGTYLPGITKKDMIFSCDSNFKMDAYFGYSEVPSIYVYNKKHIRTKKLTHETEVDKLLTFVR